MALAFLVSAPLLLMAMDPTALSAAAQTPQRLELTLEGLAPVPVLGHLKAAEMTIVADLGPGKYAIAGRVKTAGIVGWFVDYNIAMASWGAWASGAFQPSRYESNTKYGKKQRAVIVEFKPGEVVTTAKPQYGNLGEPPATVAQQLEAMDPIAAIVELASAAKATPQNPCGGPLRIFDGIQRYDLKLTFNKRIDFKSGAYKGPALLCDVEYTEIAGFKAKSPAKAAEEKADLQWARMTLAELPSGARPPVRFEAKSKKRGVLVVQATRVGFGPAPPAGAGTH